MEIAKINPIFCKAEECEYTSCYCEENIYKLCEKYLRNSLTKEEIFSSDKKPEEISKNEENLVKKPEEISKNEENPEKKPEEMSKNEENRDRIPEEMSKNVKNDKNPSKTLEQSLGFAVFITNPVQRTYLRYQKSGKPNKHGLVIWDYHVIFLNKLENNTVWVYDLDSSLPFPCEFNEYFNKALGFQMKGKPNTYFRVCESRVFIEEFSSDRSHMIKNGEYLSKPPDWECIGKGNNLLKYLDLKDESFGKVMNEKEFYEFFSK